MTSKYFLLSSASYLNHLLHNQMDLPQALTNHHLYQLAHPQTLLNQMVLVPYQAHTNQILNQMVPPHPLQNQMVYPQAHTNNMFLHQALHNQMVPHQVHPNKLVPHQALLNQILNLMVPPQAHINQILNLQTMKHRSLPLHKILPKSKRINISKKEKNLLSQRQKRAQKNPSP